MKFKRNILKFDFVGLSRVIYNQNIGYLMFMKGNLVRITLSKGRVFIHMLMEVFIQASGKMIREKVMGK
jgi:hypothetical protein